MFNTAFLGYGAATLRRPTLNTLRLVCIHNITTMIQLPPQRLCWQLYCATCLVGSMKLSSCTHWQCTIGGHIRTRHLIHHHCWHQKHTALLLSCCCCLNMSLDGHCHKAVLQQSADYSADVPVPSTKALKHQALTCYIMLQVKPYACHVLQMHWMRTGMHLRRI